MDGETRGSPLDWMAIRHRPAMYLIPVSITALQNFILGCAAGRATWAPDPFPLPRDFTGWVASRLHCNESGMGCFQILIEQLGDGREAVDRFFTLLDEYQVRVPKVVASVPPKISLISYYSEDSGLFVTAEGEGSRFCPNLSEFKRRFGLSRADLTILDQAAFDRWAQSP